ncbi:hypothetical protein GZL_03519 [Streptomyces sp. 769]|nr:hypothetical protein GZL_03519 [Streptomyces sp. 769]
MLPGPRRHPGKPSTPAGDRSYRWAGPGTAAGAGGRAGMVRARCAL